MILKGGTLFFSKEEACAPHGAIDLTECCKIDEVSGEDYEFYISGGKEKFLLRSKTKDDMRMWMSKIKAAMSNALSKQVFERSYKDMLLRGQM